jgi:hypothetical protein
MDKNMIVYERDLFEHAQVYLMRVVDRESLGNGKRPPYPVEHDCFKKPWCLKQINAWAGKTDWEVKASKSSWPGSEPRFHLEQEDADDQGGTYA